MKLMYIVFIFLFILYYFNSIEKFTITSYNDSIVPLNKQDTIYESEIKTLNELFEQNNLQGFPDIITFQKMPNYLKFPLQNIFNKVVLKKLTDIFSKNKDYDKSKFVIIKDMYDIHWKDIQNARHFIFNIDVRNEKMNWSRRLKIYIILENINDFLTDTGEYINEVLINSEFIVVNTISLEESISSLSIGGINDEIANEKFNNYYNIKNTLHLMDPYITSGSEMVITDKMKSNFVILLENRKRLREEKSKIKAGFCYNTSNLVTNTKEECIDSGGIWDYVPDNSYECPYYRANENYPNDFGKLSGDTCQLPRNMQIIGNRNFSVDPKYKPLCYNCKDNFFGNDKSSTLGFCCDDQNDNEKYPNILTPDYAFIGDNVIREKYKQLLSEKKLSIK